MNVGGAVRFLWTFGVVAHMGDMAGLGSWRGPEEMSAAAFWTR